MLCYLNKFKKNKYYICNNTNQNLSPEQVQKTGRNKEKPFN